MKNHNVDKRHCLLYWTSTFTKRKDWEPIKRTNPAIFICLSKVRTWISNFICRVFIMFS